MTGAQKATLTDPEVDYILDTLIPGGSQARHWFLPHVHEKGIANIRDVVRRMFASRAASPLPVALPAYKEALRKIADQHPKVESSVHGPRNRCQHCDYAWLPSEVETHSTDCAYVIAHMALSDPLDTSTTAAAPLVAGPAGCPDGGKCHHGCAAGSACFRVEHCAPLSASRFNEDWTLKATAAALEKEGVHICTRHDNTIVADPATGCPHCNAEAAAPDKYDSTGAMCAAWFGVQGAGAAIARVFPSPAAAPTDAKGGAL